MEARIINFLRRNFEGEITDESCRRSMVMELFKYGFDIIVSSELSQYKVINAHPYVVKTLRDESEDLDNLEVTSLVNPEISLSGFRVKEDYSLKPLELKMHERDVGDICGSVEPQEGRLSRVKLILGNKTKYLKRSPPTNSNMRGIDIMVFGYLDEAEEKAILERREERPATEYLNADVRLTLLRLNRKIRRGDTLGYTDTMDLIELKHLLKLAGEYGYERDVILIDQRTVVRVPPVIGRIYELKNGDRAGITFYKKLEPYEVEEIDRLILSVVVDRDVDADKIGLPREEIVEIKRDEFGEVLGEDVNETKIAYTIEKV
jgi:hypothetical protein